MPAYADLSKAHEVANLARRLQKELRDAINDAGKYNNRERLFDMPITNVSYVPSCFIRSLMFRLVLKSHNHVSLRMCRPTFHCELCVTSVLIYQSVNQSSIIYLTQALDP